MPKIKLSQLAEQYDVSFDEALKIAQEKLPEDQITGRGKLTWIGIEGQSILHNSMMIDEITPKHYKGVVLAECPNNRYNYVHSKEVGKRVPVLIPSQLRGRMLGKKITFEEIKDSNGATYRYIK